MDLDKFSEKYISPEDMKGLVPPEEFVEIEELVKAGKYETTGSAKEGNLLWLNTTHYVCDGREMGGPTRFMNHSCKPNCRIYTVSYNHADRNIYDLAFFASEEIPAYTELTFDYKDDGDQSVITDEQALEFEQEHDYKPIRCLCGTDECRRYFFT